jgi:hypothetical protein
LYVLSTHGLATLKYFYLLFLRLDLNQQLNLPLSSEKSESCGTKDHLLEKPDNPEREGKTLQDEDFHQRNN